MLNWIVDRRPTLPAPGDQGSRPTCLSWAITVAHEFRLSTGQLSIEFLHWNSGNYRGGRGTIVAAAEALNSDGQPEETQWPYLLTNDDTHPGYKPPSSVVGPFSRAGIRLSLVDIDELTLELGDGHLPVLAIRVTDAFLVARGGFVRDDGSGSDGHAVTAVGIAEYVGTASRDGVGPGTRLVCIRNSWGQAWGMGGYALMTEGALTACAIGAVVVDAP